MINFWFKDIPPGFYTTQQIVELSKPRQTYNCVYLRLRKLKVEKERPPLHKQTSSNEYLWNWKGAEYYIKKLEKLSK